MPTQTLPEALQAAIGELWAVVHRVDRAHTQLIRLANRLDETTKPLPMLGGEGDTHD